MKSTIRHFLAVLSLMLGTVAQASTLSFQGSFGSDDDVQIINFSLAGNFLFSARTWSFGGGVNAAGNAVTAGGFAPVLSLFSASGNQDLLQLAQAGAAGSCPAGANTDPASGFCFDVGFSLLLTAGDYMLALTQDNNTPFGPFFSDGFLQAGRGNFTGPDYLGTEGQCILVDGSQRTCNWALDIALPDPRNNVPEPGSLALLALGFLALTGAKRHPNSATC